MNKIDWKITCVGLLCITVLEIYALSQGINGVLLTGVIATIALVLGINIPKEKIMR